jgi:hypothetical protein
MEAFGGITAIAAAGAEEIAARCGISAAAARAVRAAAALALEDREAARKRLAVPGRRRRDAFSPAALAAEAAGEYETGKSPGNAPE